MRARLPLRGAVCAAVLVLVGCSGAAPDPAPPGAAGPNVVSSAQSTPTPFPAYAATAHVPLVEIHAAPEGPVTHAWTTRSPPERR